MSCSWLVSRPLRGEKEPSKAAEPMVKDRSPRPSDRRCAAGLSTLPAQISAAGLAQPLRAARVRASGIGFGRPIGEQIDAGTAHIQELPALAFHQGRIAAELGRMADGLAGKG